MSEIFGSMDGTERMQVMDENEKGGGTRAVPELSRAAAARILSNVFEACGMQPNTVPLEELEKRVQEHKLSLRQAAVVNDK